MKKDDIGSLLSPLKKYIEADNLRLHMPGHKGRDIFYEAGLTVNSCFAWDVTEIHGLDDLHNPQNAIAKAEKKMAEMFETGHSFFLVNGASAGVLASLLSLGTESGCVVVPRNSHKSLLSALIMTGLSPIYLPVTVHPTYGFPLGVAGSGADGKRWLTPDTKAVFQVRPTYEGIVQPLFENQGQSIRIVDEAHGAHLSFHESLPESAINLQADIVIHGTHKTLGSLTQTGLLHIQNKEHAERVRQALNLVQTTSPSYLLLASLEAMRIYLAAHGRKKMAQAVELGAHIRSQINQIKGFHCVTPEEVAPFTLDETKLIIISEKLTGYQLEEWLRKDYGIYMEMAQQHYMVAMITLYDSSNAAARLCSALADIAKKIEDEKKVSREIVLPPNGSLQCMSPREAHFSAKRRVLLQQAEGLVSTEFFCAYPPGIPVLYPGEMITNTVIEYIDEIRSKGYSWQGLSDQKLASIVTVQR